jgi:hypothetical protein
LAAISQSADIDLVYLKGFALISEARRLYNCKIGLLQAFYPSGNISFQAGVLPLFYRELH